MLTWTAFLLTAVLAFGVHASQGTTVPPTSDAQRLVVVDGRTGKPLEGAEVSWVEKEPVPPAEDPWDRTYRIVADAHWDLAELESLTLRGPDRARSNAEGLVTLPLPAARTWLTGRRGNLFGSNSSLRFDGTDEAMLLLWPDAALDVRALDAAGAPLGDVDVLLIVQESTETAFGARESGTVVQRVATNDDGVASLTHASVTIADRTARGGGGGRRWRVALDLLPSTAASVDLDAEAIPHNPITLRAPATGEIEIEVLETDGSPASLQYPLLLCEVDRPSASSGSTEPRLLRPDRWLSPDEQRGWAPLGKARFRNVCLGREFAVRGARHAAARASETRVAGPAVAGERTKARLVLGKDAVVFRGRAVDAAGNPLGQTQLRVEFLNGPGSSRGELAGLAGDGLLTRGRSRFESDGAGRFTVEFGSELAELGPPILVFSGGLGASRDLAARFDAQDLWSIGAHDLGDVRLALAPIVAAGIVLDAAGAPVADAEVRSGSNLRALVVTGTNADGEFELRSVVPCATLDLQILKPGFAASHLMSVRSGSSDLRITLERTSRIRAQVRLPAGVDPDGVQFRMQCVKRIGTGEPLTHVGSVGRDGLLQVDDCAPGSYRLVLSPQRKSGARRMVIEDINVGPGEVRNLGIIDLPGG